MANDKKNINELVIDDDDPIAELEAMVLPQSYVSVRSEIATSTTGYGNGGDDNDIAISDLKSDLESRSKTINCLQFDLEKLRARWLGLETEIQARERLTHRINGELNELKDELQRMTDLLKKRDQEIDALHISHAKEIRAIRFELGEAQETMSQHELINEQLASDLVENRGYRVELESMLSKSEDISKSRIERLEKENRELRRESSELDGKLEAKSESINCLLSELSRKSQQIDSISEIENVIHEIDDRISERIDLHAPVERDRITRVLIGSVEGLEVRFPLFKDRLTIGRTQQNDIQLKGAHVSRRHAVIVTDGDATRVIDWGSKNGVFVNSKQITEQFLKSGDRVIVGTAEFRYEERPKRDD